MPSYSAEQSGGWVLAAFKNPDKYLGTMLPTTLARPFRQG